MDEYIESEALLNRLKHRVAPMSDGEQLIKGVNLALEILEEAVAMLPAADVEPVVHGHWVYGCQCSVCGDRHGPYNSRHKPFYNYCPNCGARMDEEEHKDNV